MGWHNTQAYRSCKFCLIVSKFSCWTAFPLARSNRGLWSDHNSATSIGCGLYGTLYAAGHQYIALQESAGAEESICLLGSLCSWCLDLYDICTACDDIGLCADCQVGWEIDKVEWSIYFWNSLRLSYREWMPSNPAIVDPDELENIWNVNNSCWLMVGSIMQQGCDILPRWVGIGRCIIYIVCLP